MRVAGPWRPDRSRSPRHRRGGSAGSTRRAAGGHGRTPSRRPGTRSPHLPDRASPRPAARTAAPGRARGASRAPATLARQERSTRDCVRRSCACPHRPSTDVGASGSILESPSLVPPGPYGRGTAMAQPPVRRIVLAYSGGLDTSVILRWLIERYQAEVVAFCADLGQGEELGGLDEKARRTGATKLVVEDLREEFVRDYVFPMLRAGAIYENQYLLGTSIARPLIAKRQVEVARREGADGERLSPPALLARLIALAGAHGVGRVDVVENRYIGMKSRGVYETPGGTVLRAAFQAVESLTLDREVMHLRDSLVPRYAEMVYYGYWFAPERLMLQAAVDEAARAVTGTARLRLYRGSVRTIGRKAPRSLYDPRLVSFDEAGGYRQEDAGGFIRLAGLRLRLRTLVEQTRT